MNHDMTHLVEQIHAADGKILLAASGVGTQAIAWLMGVSGASRSVLECIVPYSKTAFDSWLEREPDKYVSEKSALRLAGRMHVRAQLLDSSGERLIGCACTGAIATDRPKKGQHQAFIATWTTTQIAVWHITLTKNARSRAQEEQLISCFLLNMLANAYGISDHIPLELLPTDTVDKTHYDLAAAVDALYAGAFPYVGVYDFGRIATTSISPEIVLSGSFNPLHKGHLALHDAATQFLGKPLAFELSIRNVDKPALDQADTLRRAAQFAGRYPIYLTNASTFLEKARIFKGTTFVIGCDTATRIVQPRYYHDSIDATTAALREMQMLGCQFIVAGRVADDHFLTLEDLEIAPEFRPMFTPLPNFRADISSTQLRAQNSVGDR
jgi:nicotinamide mononucleotide (NMN) deamidase PncC